MRLTPTMLRILIVALLVGFCPVPVSDFMIGIGFAPVCFVLFWIGLELVSYPSPLYLIYLVEAVLYMALFWLLAGGVRAMPPRGRGLAGAAVLAVSVLLWLAPIHIRIERGIGAQKPLAALFEYEYLRFQDLRAMQRTADMTIYRPPPGTVHTRAVAPQIQSKPTVHQGVVQQSAAEVTVPRTDE